MISKDEKSLNELLVSLFGQVMTTESKAVITEEFKDMTENEMHILEAVGTDDKNPMKVSDIAAKLGVTTSTLTINMNALEKKGYVVRERSTKDKRIVYVRLTERGRKAFFHHRDFHKKMIKSIVSGLSKEERRVLIDCLYRLQEFFESYGED
ncbi:MAG: MarR family transcriptional regulator [Lachnospiraceae bacterium]|nr:MarR family transcriptional regulator [Lachnospiraceae bacterium]